MSSSRVVLLAAVALLFIWTAAAAGGYRIIVTSEDGSTLWTAAVSRGSVVTLEYTNSLYLALTQEHFTVTPRGFALTEIWSTSDAVLASNSLPGPYARRSTFFVSSLNVLVPQIVTRIGSTGQQTLRVGDQELPLYKAGTGARVTVTVRRGFPPASFRSLLER